MKIIFAGTPEFAIPALEALLNSNHEVCVVYTQPDRPAGRGLKLTATPIKNFAQEHNLQVIQPQSLRDEVNAKQMEDFNADILIDVACGLFLPKSILTIPRYGCINIHPSLLPRWRGAAPIQRAILAGDSDTGVTIMQMDMGLDTGDILLQSKIQIENTDTTATLNQKLAIEGAKLLLQTLNEIEAGTITSTPQDNSLSCYANKITKEEAYINWNLTAIEIDRMIRAFNPWPVAYADINGITVRIWEAIPLEHQLNSNDKPGSIIKATKDGIDIATAKGIIRLQKIQFPGGKQLKVVDVLNSRHEWLKPIHIDH